MDFIELFPNERFNSTGLCLDNATTYSNCLISNKSFDFTDLSHISVSCFPTYQSISYMSRWHFFIFSDQVTNEFSISLTRVEFQWFFPNEHLDFSDLSRWLFYVFLNTCFEINSLDFTDFVVFHWPVSKRTPKYKCLKDISSYFSDLFPNETPQFLVFQWLVFKQTIRFH